MTHLHYLMGNLVPLLHSSVCEKVLPYNGQTCPFLKLLQLGLSPLNFIRWSDTSLSPWFSWGLNTWVWPKSQTQRLEKARRLMWLSGTSHLLTHLPTRWEAVLIICHPAPGRVHVTESVLSKSWVNKWAFRPVLALLAYPCVVSIEIAID